MTADELFVALREWLRMHGDYDVHLRLWALYGTYHISVTYLGRELWDDRGMDLEKRLARALDFVRNHAEVAAS